MKKSRKSDVHDTYYLEVEDIFPIQDRTTMETQFIERCLDKMHINLEDENQEDIILTNKQMIHLLTGVIREWDDFGEQCLIDLMTPPEQKPSKKTEKTDYDDLNYIKLRDILTTDDILASLETDEPDKMKFIRDYLNDRLKVNMEKDDLFVFEPPDTQHVILLIYDIVRTFENETQNL